MSQSARTLSGAGRPDVRQIVTDQIITALEDGTLPWRRPWTPSQAGLDTRPRNARTGRPYSGINLLLLMMAAFRFGGDDPRWITYRAAEKAGWQVRRGATGTRIFYYGTGTGTGTRPSDVGTGDVHGEGGETRGYGFYKPYTIFHASQVEGIDPIEQMVPPQPQWHAPDQVRAMLANSGAMIRHGGTKAFYAPSQDFIQLPHEADFHDAYGWASTAAHELVHWTGSSARLDRDLTGRFGGDGYAREELVAELGASMIAMTLGLPCDVANHAAYISSWLEILKKDKAEIFRAAAHARRAADYCLGFAGCAEADDAAEDETATRTDSVEACL